MAEQSTSKNRLLSRLTLDDFALLADKLEFHECGHSTVFWEADEPMKSAFFPETGLVSVIAESSEGRVAEAGIIGREGFVHPALVLGSGLIPYKVQVQIPGSAHRILADDLVRATEESPTLLRTLLLFAHANGVQANFSSLSNAVHSVEERLARWLLMCHARSDSDDLALTHKFIGVMLAVRRPSVTSSLHVLEGGGMIESSRGYITITNRAALEAFAGDAYGKPEAEYRRILGPL